MLEWILLTAVAASSPPSPASRTGDQSQQIIVEGQRGRDRAIHDFVKAVTPSRVGGQLSRYDIEACPASVGLSEAQNFRVTQRLREVAAAAGVPLAKKNCGPNALVIVVDRKDDFLAALDKRYPAYFSDMINGAMKPPKEPGPATAWHITGSMSSDHIPTTVNHPGATGVPGTYYVSSSMDASRLIPPRIPHFLAGVLVVEARSLSGLTTTQLADYAAMRLYATSDPTKLMPSASSILGILDAPMGTPIPLTLTTWDLSFLKALYRSDDRQFANRQRGQIEGMVKRDTSPRSRDWRH